MLDSAPARRVRHKTMNMQNPMVDVPTSVNFSRATRPRVQAGGLSCLVLGSLLIFFLTPARGQATGSQPAPNVVQADVKLVIGGETIKNNSEGTLSVTGNSLQFATTKKKKLE